MEEEFSMQSSKLEATSSSLASAEGDLATQSRLLTAIGTEASASRDFHSSTS